MNPSGVTASYRNPPYTHQGYRGMGGNILVGMVVKAKLGELEDEVREGFSGIMMK